MRASLFVFCISLILFFDACQNDTAFKKTKNGLEYIFHHKEDTGSKGKPGDYYLFDLIVRTSYDSVISNSYESGSPSKFIRRKSLYPGDIYEALSMCATGDSMSFKLRADSFYMSHQFGYPDFLPKGEILTFTIKMREILSPTGFKMKMFNEELDAMEKFTAKKGWKVQTDSSSGIKYEILRRSDKGNNLKDGDNVALSYFYYYLNDQIIARSKDGEPWNFTVGDPNHIEGLSQLLKLCKKGDKVRAILPFSTAFGDSGRAAIPPYSTIVLELDIQP